MLFMWLSSAALAAPEGSCREHPLVNGPCFRLYARLSRYNGTPSARLWPVGTSRLLGISEGRFALDGYRNLPEDIDRLSTFESDLFGNFLVCPFTDDEPGVMRFVCVESVEDLVIRASAPPAPQN